mmetsp:Transcript_34625/g.78457  ORF Transcript_34625/g.78457 Transcript_34625/m.78457 type:complete len:252 (-) Transcript_34625:592-1347(-)
MLRPHLTTRRPVLIRGAALSMQTRWTMSAMLRKYGDEVFNVSLIPYAETFGKRSLPPEHRLVRDLPNFTQSGRLSVREYFTYLNAVSAADSRDRSPVHLFDVFACEGNNCHGSSLSWLDQDAEWLQPVADSLVFDGLPLVKRNYQFYLGPPNSGSPVHHHHDAVNILIHGRKRWFLFPPGDAFYTTQPPGVWRDEYELPSGTVPFALECVQQGGDILLVPAQWGHATLNIETSVGMAIEFWHRSGMFTHVQ